MNVSGASRAKRIKTWGLPAGLTIIALGGLAVWKFWPSTEPAVSVPSRVCQGKLSGSLVTGLLPKKGAAFKDSSGVEFGQPPQPGVIPECGLWAGGQGITIRYSQLGDSGQGIAKKWRSDNERVANQSGFAHIKLGEASGFSGPYGAGLIISCPKDSDSAAILKVDVEYTKRASTPDSREEFAQLAVETLRVSAKDIVKCRGAENIPDGPPQIS